MLRVARININTVPQVQSYEIIQKRKLVLQQSGSRASQDKQQQWVTTKSKKKLLLAYTVGVF